MGVLGPSKLNSSRLRQEYWTAGCVFLNFSRLKQKKTKLSELICNTTKHIIVYISTIPKCGVATLYKELIGIM